MAHFCEVPGKAIPRLARQRNFLTFSVSEAQKKFWAIAPRVSPVSVRNSLSVLDWDQVRG
jgi:hypothetical protein